MKLTTFQSEKLLLLIILFFSKMVYGFSPVSLVSVSVGTGIPSFSSPETGLVSDPGTEALFPRVPLNPEWEPDACFVKSSPTLEEVIAALEPDKLLDDIRDKLIISPELVIKVTGSPGLEQWIGLSHTGGSREYSYSDGQSVTEPQRFAGRKPDLEINYRSRLELIKISEAGIWCDAGAPVAEFSAGLDEDDQGTGMLELLLSHFAITGEYVIKVLAPTGERLLIIRNSTGIILVIDETTLLDLLDCKLLPVSGGGGSLLGTRQPPVDIKSNNWSKKVRKKMDPQGSGSSGRFFQRAGGSERTAHSHRADPQPPQSPHSQQETAQRQAEQPRRMSSQELSLKIKQVAKNNGDSIFAGKERAVLEGLNLQSAQIERFIRDAWYDGGVHKAPFKAMDTFTHIHAHFSTTQTIRIFIEGCQYAQIDVLKISAMEKEFKVLGLLEDPDIPVSHSTNPSPEVIALRTSVLTLRKSEQEAIANSNEFQRTLSETHRELDRYIDENRELVRTIEQLGAKNAALEAMVGALPAAQTQPAPKSAGRGLITSHVALQSPGVQMLLDARFYEAGPVDRRKFVRDFIGMGGSAQYFGDLLVAIGCIEDDSTIAACKADHPLSVEECMVTMFYKATGRNNLTFREFVGAMDPNEQRKLLSKILSRINKK